MIHHVLDDFHRQTILFLLHPSDLSPSDLSHLIPDPCHPIPLVLCADSRAMAIATPFPFLSLPLELREQIYSIYFKPADRLRTSRDLEAQGLFGGIYKFEFDLLRVNRQIYEESNKVWRRENVFVKVATPWPSAGMYRVYLMSEMGWGNEDEGMSCRASLPSLFIPKHNCIPICRARPSRTNADVFFSCY